MAISDILAQSGDEQDFIIELPVGNSSYYPLDILVGENDVLLCNEVPIIENNGGGNIFIMSE